MSRLFNRVKNLDIFKFAIIGGFTSFLLLILTEIFTSLHLFYAFSAIIGFEISLIIGFYLHDNWTFVNLKKSTRSTTRLLKYNLFSLLGLGINELILIFLTEQIKLHYLLSEGVAIMITFIFNFTISKKISWRN